MTKRSKVNFISRDMLHLSKCKHIIVPKVRVADYEALGDQKICSEYRDFIVISELNTMKSLYSEQIFWSPNPM